MTLFRRKVAYTIKQPLDLKSIGQWKSGVPCHIWLRWPGDMVRGMLWAGGDSVSSGVSSAHLPDQS